MSDNEKENVVQETSSVQIEKESNNSSSKDNDTMDADSEFGDFDNEDTEFGDFDDNNDFGDFDNNDFGDFEEEGQSNSVKEDDGQDSPINTDAHQEDSAIKNDNPMTLGEIFELWSAFVKEIYTFQPIESFTNSNSTKSIKVYVLEEAQESLHSRITWDSVTKYMEDDTGIPKVRWVNSEIEKLHLKALSCQRSTSPLSMAPTMLDISQANNLDHDVTTPTHPMTIVPETMKCPTCNTPPPPVQSPTYNTPPSMQSPARSTPPPPVDTKMPVSPTSEKRSSIFGLSSLSRFLPHLSKSKLPSPTSPTTPRIIVPNHNIVTSPPMNHMNIQQPTKEHLKRSNTVAFSSSSHPKMRPISSQSMDLLDLFEDSTPNTTFTPLVPTASTSTPQQPRRYTIPANMHSDVKPATVVEDDDDFGDFTGEETDLGSNVGVFDTVSSTRMVRSKTEPVIDKVVSSGTTMDDYFQKTSHDPFDYFRKTTPLQSDPSPVQSDDPYDRASYFKKVPSPKLEDISKPQHDPFDLFFESKSQPSKTIPNSDLLSPVHKTTSAKQELFDSFMSSTTKETQADDEDWGDWAF